MLKLFVLEYRKLLNFCNSPNFDMDVFSILHDRYAKAYQKLNYEEQGWITEEICKND